MVSDCYPEGSMIRASDYVTTGRLSAANRVHRNSVLKAIWSGRLRAILIDGRYLIPAVDAARYEPRPRRQASVVAAEVG